MAVSALIIGTLMIVAGLVMSLAMLRSGSDAVQGTNRYSVALVLVGVGCLACMASLLTVW